MEKKSLFPVIRAPEFNPPNNKTDLAYQPGVKFNLQTGDFTRDGSNRLIRCDGKSAYQLWCYKMALTERYTCLAYPGRYGVEMKNALKEPDDKAVETAIQRTITEALKVNPRTEYVRDFSFEWEGDILQCSFAVKGINMEEFTLTIDVGKAEEAGGDAE